MPTPQPTAISDVCSDFVAWVRREPVQALLLGALLAGAVYFFGYYRVFIDETSSALRWAWKAWNDENDLEYGGFIFPAAIVIAWYHRDALRAAPKAHSWGGLVLTFVGALLYVLSVRALQPRLSLIALPLLIYGGVRFLWGAATARIILFPCAFLLFMVPAGFLVSRTVALQNLAAFVAAKLSSLIGIGVVADGTTLHALDKSFDFEVAGGCSGIRSLTAMTMLAAVFVHFTQREWWKKAIIFGGSLVFALLGNLVRIFSVVVLAKLINPKIAGGLYHDWSGFIFFPIAVMSMLGVANLLNHDWSAWLTPAPAKSQAAGPAAAAEPARPSPVSYDY